VQARLALIAVIVLALVSGCTDSPPSGCDVWKQAAPPAGYVSDVLALADDDVWLAGQGGEDFRGSVFHWEGRRWHSVQTARLDARHIWLTSIAGVAPDDIWASGIAFPKDTDRLSHPVVEHWDGRTWSAVPLPDLGSSQGSMGGLSAISADEVWAAGWYGERNHHHPLVQRWDGRTWARVPVPDQFRDLYALGGFSAIASDDVWLLAMGEGDTLGERIITLHWDGHGWTRFPGPVFGPTEPRLLEATSLYLKGITAIGRDDVWMFGEYEPARKVGRHATPGRQQALFAHWDGGRWSVISDPELPGRVNALAGRSPDDVWAVGVQGSPTRPVTWHWDGHKWSEAPSPQVGVGPQHMDDFRTNELFTLSIAPDGTAWAAGQYAVGEENDIDTLVEVCRTP